MKSAQIISKDFEFGTLFFVIEKLTEGYSHPCSTIDIMSLLEKLPNEDLKGLKFIVLHQPSCKEEISSPRWAAFYPEYSCENLTGSAILLEAVNPSIPLKWKNSLIPEDQRELELLESEGHKITREKRRILISMDLPSVRNTQLQRSFIHELGHYVDYKRNPERFNEKTTAEKENFANKYFSQIRI